MNLNILWKTIPQLLNYVNGGKYLICHLKDFSTRGIKYRELKLKDKLPEMSEKEQLNLLATDGMLVKRPIIVTDNFVLVGFKVKEWEEKLS